MILDDIVTAGRRVVVGLATWLAGQEQSLDNARHASTEVSRRRVEREEVTLYLDELHPAEDDGPSSEQWPGSSAQTAD